MEDIQHDKHTQNPAVEAIDGQPGFKKNTLHFDPYFYLPMLEDEDISEEQKLELIRTLYAIVHAFIDLGFAVDFAEAPCGKDHKSAPLAPQALRDHVYSNHQKSLKNFHSAAATPAEAENEGVSL